MCIGSSTASLSSSLIHSPSPIHVLIVLTRLFAPRHEKDACCRSPLEKVAQVEHNSRVIPRRAPSLCLVDVFGDGGHRDAAGDVRSRPNRLTQQFHSCEMISEQRECQGETQNKGVLSATLILQGHFWHRLGIAEYLDHVLRNQW